MVVVMVMVMVMVIVIVIVIVIVMVMVVVIAIAIAIVAVAVCTVLVCIGMELRTDDWHQQRVGEYCCEHSQTEGNGQGDRWRHRLRGGRCF
jgi:hypothetical protein